MRIVRKGPLALTYLLLVAVAGLAAPRAMADTLATAQLSTQLNDLRASVGAPPTSGDGRIDAAATAHATYLAQNGASGHFETAGLPGYTGYAPRDRLVAQGYVATFVSEVATSGASALAGELQLWDAPYHRLGMLHPHNVAAGWGYASISGRQATVGDFVYDFSSPAPDFVRSPADRQTGIPTSWNGRESPNPLPASVATPVGYPIMVVYSNARAVQLRSAQLVRTSDGTAVPFYVAPQQFEYDYQVIVPRDPLAPNTTYQVRFDLTVAGAATTNEWTFTTNGGGAFVVPSLHSDWVDQTTPPALAPGQTASVTVRLRNTGGTAWERGTARQVNLGVARDSTAAADAGIAVGWLSPNRVATTQEASVAPGAIGTFSFQVCAPATPGAYRVNLRPVVDGVAWLEDQGVFLMVISDLGYHSAWVDESAFPTLRAGEVSGDLVVRFRNAGTKPWVRGVMGQQANLGVVGDDERWASLGVGWPTANRVATTQESLVAPGGVGTFSFRVRAPAVPGTYDIRLRPVIDATTWLEDEGVWLRITVVP